MPKTKTDVTHCPATEKPKKRPGRPKGSKTRHSRISPAQAAPADLTRAGDLPAIVATSFLEAFERLGGVQGLVQWGRRNPSAFYKQIAAVVGRAALVKGVKGRGLQVLLEDGRPSDGTAPN